MDVISVSACVQAVTSAFRDAAGLVRRIKEKQDSTDGEECSNEQINDLEISLDLGPPIVQRQYHGDFRKFGETYARGDSIAREQLKDVLITLQMAVLSNLTGVWMGTRSLDYTELQTASDDSRVNAVSCLVQWQQRLSSATCQQQKSTPYPTGVNSRPMTPPLTNISSHSERSSLGAGRPLTPDEASDQMASLSMATMAPESEYTSPTIPGQSITQNSYPQSGGKGHIDMPSPLFARSRLSGSRQELLRPSDVAQAIPVRSPYRPSVGMPQLTPQPRLMTDPLSRGFPSPVSPLGPENEHHDADDFDTSSLPRSLQSPTPNLAELYNPTLHGTQRAPSSGSRSSLTHSTNLDHSTLEHVSFLDSSSSDTHPAYPNDHYPPRTDSFTTVPPRNRSQNPPPPPPTDPQTQRGHRTPSICAPIPILHRNASTSTAPSITTTLSRPSLSLNLPEESNSYLGFCKGAYKLQIGLPRKKAFDIETRPAGMYTSYQVWRCKKCSFEGPISFTTALPGSGKKKAGKAEKVFDPRVRTSAGGVVYRWAFLAKCHVACKGVAGVAMGVRDGSVGTFGCLFCCAEGVGRGWLEEKRDEGGVGAGGTRRPGSTTSTTPMFGNVESFMQHLQMHRSVEGMPGVEMQIRMKCVVGRVAELGEDWDINLPPLDE